MCRPPDITPTPSSRLQDGLVSQSYTAEGLPQAAWEAQQQAWNNLDPSNFNWSDLSSPGVNSIQANSFNYDSSSINPHISLNFPINTSYFSENVSSLDATGFVGSSISQNFNQGDTWRGNVKVPLKPSGHYTGPTPSKIVPGYPELQSQLPNAALPIQQASNQPHASDTNQMKATQWSKAPPSSEVKIHGIKINSWSRIPPGNMNDMLDDDNYDDSSVVNDKKIKRMLSNRASAKRSRQRRQERLDELEIQSAKLHVEHAAVTRKLNEALDSIRRYQDENVRLKKEVEHLMLQATSSKRQKLSSSSSENNGANKSQLDDVRSNIKMEAFSDKTDEALSHDSSFKGNSTVDRISTKISNSSVFSIPLSPDSIMTAGLTSQDSHSGSIPQDLKSFSMSPNSPDIISKELNSLDDDWFSSFVEIFDDQPLCPS